MVCDDTTYDERARVVTCVAWGEGDVYCGQRVVAQSVKAYGTPLRSVVQSNGMLCGAGVGAGCTGRGVVCCVWHYDALWCTGRGVVCCVLNYDALWCTGRGVVCCVLNYDTLWCEQLQYSCR